MTETEKTMKTKYRLLSIEQKCVKCGQHSR